MSDKDNEIFGRLDGGHAPMEAGEWLQKGQLARPDNQIVRPEQVVSNPPIGGSSIMPPLDTNVPSSTASNDTGDDK